MISQNKKKLKLIDFGNALFVEAIPRISDLLARYYKPPEVMVGYGWDFAIDVWSAACSLFELFTGNVLFSGNNDNHMLKQIFELRGCYNQKVLKKAMFVQEHFDVQKNLFLSVETDPISKQVDANFTRLSSRRCRSGLSKGRSSTKG